MKHCKSNIHKIDLSLDPFNEIYVRKAEAFVVENNAVEFCITKTTFPDSRYFIHVIKCNNRQKSKYF